MNRQTAKTLYPDARLVRRVPQDNRFPVTYNVVDGESAISITYPGTYYTPREAWRAVKVPS